MAKDKRVYKIIAEVKDAEVRGVELVENTFDIDGKEVKQKYIDLKVDDVNGDRIYLKDKNVDNLPKYARGKVGDFTITIDVEEDFKTKTTILVKAFKEKK